ncbi:hypothetical protein COOONC_11668 [Cooperia oncophora]
MNKTPRETAEEGDKHYMAPEILNDPPTTAADIYSLGVSLLELATTIDLREQSPKVRNGELSDELFGSMHQKLREMILSLIRTDPHDRPTTNEIHPPSLRFSKPRVPLRDLRRDEIADTVEGVRTCLRFEDSSDDDSPSCRSEK